MIDYEATLEDPEVFTKPWKISLGLGVRKAESFAAPCMQQPAPKRTVNVAVDLPDSPKMSGTACT